MGDRAVSEELINEHTLDLVARTVINFKRGEWEATFLSHSRAIAA